MDDLDNLPDPGALGRGREVTGQLESGRLESGHLKLSRVTSNCETVQVKRGLRMVWYGATEENVENGGSAYLF